MSDDRDPFERLRKLSAPGVLLDPEVLAKILEVLPLAVIAIDESRVIRYVNHEAELLFGYPRRLLHGELLDILVPDDIRAKHMEHVKGFFASPRSRPMGLGLVLKGRHRSGTEIPLDINLNAIVTDDGVYAIAAIGRPRNDGTAAR